MCECMHLQASSRLIEEKKNTMLEKKVLVVMQMNAIKSDGKSKQIDGRGLGPVKRVKPTPISPPACISSGEGCQGYERAEARG